MTSSRPGARPPLAVVLRYRLLRRRPAAAYDDWLGADLDGRWFPVRYAVLGVVVPVVVLLAGWWGGASLGLWGAPDTVLVVAVAVVLAVVDLVRALVRRESIREHLFGDRREVGHFQPYVHLEEDR